MIATLIWRCFAGSLELMLELGDDMLIVWRRLQTVGLGSGNQTLEVIL